jgi:ornithine carbamoyltransferase
LPAHRGEEVSGDILDSPRSVVFDQAENRMHLTKALLSHMLGGLEIPLAGYH